MALPGDIATIILTGTYLDMSGNARSGSVTFTPSTPILVDSGSPTILGGIPVIVALTAGAFSVVLPCTSGLSPSGWAWNVTESISGAPQRSYSIALPHSLGSTVDLSTLTPAGAVPPGAAYLPVPSGTATAGYYPGATGAGEGTAWTAPGGGGGAVDTVGAVDASIVVVGGATANPTVETGTLDAIATLHPPAASVPMNSQKLTGLANGSASADSAAYGQTPAGGNTVTIAHGGTGQTTAAAALTALGAAALAGAAFSGEVTVQAPVNPFDAVTKSYADAIAQGLSVKPSVQEATASALPSNTYANGTAGVGATLTATANGALTVDGTAVSASDRVLVQNEGTASHNGIYTVTATGSGGAPYVLTRAADMNTAAQAPGAFAFCEQGAVNAGAGFAVASPGPFTIGTTAITWTQFSGAGEVTAGTGLSKSGNTIGLSGPVSLANGGTGQTTAQAALNALAGAQTSGQYARGNGTNVVMSAIQAGDGVVMATGGGQETVSANAAATGAVALNLANGNVFNHTLAGAVVYTVTGAVTGVACSITLYVTQAASGGPYGVTWFSGITWLSGAAPTIPAAAGNVTAYVFETLNGGGTWFGSAITGPSLPLSLANGGTSAVTQQAALNALAGAVTSGQYARGNGTNVVMSAILPADVPGVGASVFLPESYGCQGNGQLISDAAITSGQNTLTTAGVANASTAPTLATATTGGTVLAGTYQAEYTFVSALGETLASSSASITTTGSASTVTMTSPGAVPGGAIGYHVYITAAGGSTYYRQTQAALPWPFANNFTLAAPPVTTTPNPPGSNTTASAPFAPAMVGQSIRVVGAGTSGADLVTTNSAYASAASVTLAANAGTTVARSGAVFGTDDTANFNACLAAAAAYAAAGNYAAEVVCRPVIYLLATAPTVGGSYQGNCVIPIPNAPNGGPKSKIAVRGASRDSATFPVYQQMIPETSGTCFLYIGANGTNNTTYGPASVFGTPILGTVYGGESGALPGTANIKIILDSLRVIVPWAGGISAYDLFSAAQCAVYNCSASALAVPPSGGSWQQMISLGPTTNQWGWGLRMPASGNNAMCYAQQVTIEGFCYGFGPSELTVADDIAVVYCVTGVEAHSGNGTPMVHSGVINYCTVQYCRNGVGAYDGTIRLDVGRMNLESTSIWVYDPSDRLIGSIGVWYQGSINNYSAALTTNTTFGAAPQVSVTNLNTVPGPLSSPQAPPGSSPGTWFNGYFVPVWVTLSATTITALTITGMDGTAVAQGGLAGSPASYQFPLGPGWSYTATWTGTLTHTVMTRPGG